MLNAANFCLLRQWNSEYILEKNFLDPNVIIILILQIVNTTFYGPERALKIYTKNFKKVKVHFISDQVLLFFSTI